MPSERDKPKRWRPRLSVRTLVILVTLVCCYFGLWEATKRQGTKDVVEFIQIPYSAEPIAPLLFRHRATLTHSYRPSTKLWQVTDVTTYYFWCFGYVSPFPWTTREEVGFAK